MTTTIVDGPAAGKHLMLRRSPCFLRVVRTQAGEVDALDQLDDSPKPGETCFAYRLFTFDGHCHILRTDKRGRRCGGFYSIASYVVHEDQPSQDVMRNASDWQEWCQKQPFDHGGQAGPIARGSELAIELQRFRAGYFQLSGERDMTRGEMNVLAYATALVDHWRANPDQPRSIREVRLWDAVDAMQEQRTRLDWKERLERIATAAGSHS